MNKKFNQKEYIKEHNKKKYSQFKTELKKEEKKEIDKYLNIFNLSKAEFIRNSFKKFKEEMKMKKYLILTDCVAYKKLSDKRLSYESYTLFNKIDEYDKKIFDNIDDAIEYYNNVPIEISEDMQSFFIDEKYLYCCDASLIEDLDEIPDPDEMELLKEEYATNEEFKKYEVIN